MNRYMLLAAAATLVGVTALVIAPGGIRSAEGCSGAGPATCKSPGWSAVSWAVDPTGVPTDGALRVSLAASYMCNYGAGGAGGAGAGVTMSVLGPDGAVVAGKPDAQAAPPIAYKVGGISYDSTETLTWQPAAPFAPNATYTLHVEGLVGAKSVDLLFTTGAGPFAPPKPLLDMPGLSVNKAHFGGKAISCSKPPGPPTYCGGTTTSAQQLIAPAPVFSAKIGVDEPVAAAKAFLVASLRVSVAGGPFTNVSPPVELAGAKGTICAEVVATNTLTGATATSAPWCGTTDTLDLATSPNCTALAAVIADCGGGAGSGGGGPSGWLLSPGAASIYAEVCGSAGSGGTGGAGGGPSSGAGGAGSTGGTSSTGGAGGMASTGGAGGMASTGTAGSNVGGSAMADAGSAGAGAALPAGAAVADSNSDDGGGCSVGAGARPLNHGSALAAVALALLTAARSRKSRENR